MVMQKAVANWILSDISRILNEKELEPENVPFTAEQLAKNDRINRQRNNKFSNC